MSLAEYKAEHRVITLKGGSFEVKGLSLDAFTTLVRTHLPDLESLFALIDSTLQGKADLNELDIEKLVMTFAEQAPGFSASVITLASGESGEAAIAGARSLPFPVQVNTLIEIVDLTFSEVGGVKKAFESITGLLAKTNPVSTQIPAIPSRK